MDLDGDGCGRLGRWPLLKFIPQNWLQGAPLARSQQTSTRAQLRATEILPISIDFVMKGFWWHASHSWLAYWHVGAASDGIYIGSYTL